MRHNKLTRVMLTTAVFQKGIASMRLYACQVGGVSGWWNDDKAVGLDFGELEDGLLVITRLRPPRITSSSGSFFSLSPVEVLSEGHPA